MIWSRWHLATTTCIEPADLHETAASWGSLAHHLPEQLHRPGPWGVLFWQWLILPLVMVGSWLVGYALSRATRWLLSRAAARTSTVWDDAILGQVGGPLTLGWTVAIAAALIPLLDLHQSAQELAHRLFRGGFLVAVFWFLARSLNVGRELIAQSPWAKDHPASLSLLPLATRVGQVLLLAVALVALLSELGYPVASLVAGLGIGGLAVALAAQKTVENLFGAFSISADQPFREGDFVRIDDCMGTVEAIGLRSTRIRTLDRTLVSIPNGKLAEMRTECFSARDRIRLACTVGLVYETTASQMREVLSGIERVLKEHPKIWPDTIVVRFKELGSSSLDIEVMAWFLTSDWGEFQLIRQEVLLQFMETVARAGSSFAFPTQTVHWSPSGSRALPCD